MVGKNLMAGNGRAGPSPSGMHSQDKFRLDTLTYCREFPHRNDEKVELCGG
jgi:hypothetical protein